MTRGREAGGTGEEVLSSEFSEGVRVDQIRLVCLVQPNKPNRQKNKRNHPARASVG